MCVSVAILQPKRSNLSPAVPICVAYFVGSPSAHLPFCRSYWRCLFMGKRKRVHSNRDHPLKSKTTPPPFSIMHDVITAHECAMTSWIVRCDLAPNVCVEVVAHITHIITYTLLTHSLTPRKVYCLGSNIMQIWSQRNISLMSLVEIYDLVVEFLTAFWAWGLTVRLVTNSDSVHWGQT